MNYPLFKIPTSMKSYSELVSGLLPRKLSTELFSGSGKSLPCPPRKRDPYRTGALTKVNFCRYIGALAGIPGKRPGHLPNKMFINYFGNHFARRGGGKEELGKGTRFESLNFSLSICGVLTHFLAEGGEKVRADPSNRVFQRGNLYLQV